MYVPKKQTNVSNYRTDIDDTKPKRKMSTNYAAYPNQKLRLYVLLLQFN